MIFTLFYSFILKYKYFFFQFHFKNHWGNLLPYSAHNTQILMFMQKVSDIIIKNKIRANIYGASTVY